MTHTAEDGDLGLHNVGYQFLVVLLRGLQAHPDSSWFQEDGWPPTTLRLVCREWRQAVDDTSLAPKAVRFPNLLSTAGDPNLSGLSRMLRLRVTATPGAPCCTAKLSCMVGRPQYVWLPATVTSTGLLDAAGAGEVAGAGAALRGARRSGRQRSVLQVAVQPEATCRLYQAVYAALGESLESLELGFGGEEVYQELVESKAVDTVTAWGVSQQLIQQFQDLLPRLLPSPGTAPNLSTLRMSLPIRRDEQAAGGRIEQCCAALLPALAQFTGLQRLELSAEAASQDPQPQALLQLPRGLTALGLHWGMQSAWAQQALAGLERLQELHLSHISHEDQDLLMPLLAGLPRLTELSLGLDARGTCLDQLLRPLLRALPLLRRLHVRNSAAFVGAGSGGEQGGAEPPAPHLHLQQLRLDLQGSTDMLQSLELLPALQRLQIMWADDPWGVAVAEALMVVPAGLWQLSRLSSLVLYGMDCAAGGSLSELAALEELELIGCQLSRLPAGLPACSRLTRLAVGGERTFNDNNFSSAAGLGCSLAPLAASLRDLDLTHAQLREAPEGLGACSALTRLRAGGRNNFGGGFGCSLAALAALQELVMPACRLPAAPEGLGACTALTHLNLSGCDFGGSAEGLGCSLGALRRLRRLELASCCLVQAPQGLGASQSMLTWLDLWDNRFAGSLHASLAGLTSLRHLRLGLPPASNPRSYGLQRAPEGLAALTALRTLDLAGNPMSAGLGCSLAGLTALQELSASRCQLPAAPEGLPPSLTALLLADNDFYEGLGGCDLAPLSALRHLELHNCKLPAPPPGLTALSQLLRASLSGNCFQGPPSSDLLDWAGRVLGVGARQASSEWFGWEGPPLQRPAPVGAGAEVDVGEDGELDFGCSLFD